MAHFIFELCLACLDLIYLRVTLCSALASLHMIALLLSLFFMQ